MPPPPWRAPHKPGVTEGSASLVRTALASPPVAEAAGVTPAIGSLTPTEADVVALVADNLTKPTDRRTTSHGRYSGEDARRTRAFTKLDVSTRTELAGPRYGGAIPS